MEFLLKKHQGDDNRYQALRVYKTQCRKPEAIKEQLRNTHRDLVERRFMVRFESLSKEQQDIIKGAHFRHDYPWRAVHKEGSVSTPVRIVVTLPPPASMCVWPRERTC